MSTPIKENSKAVSDAFFALCDQIEKVPFTSFDWVGDQAVRAIQALAPVDTGFLRRNIKKIKSTARTVKVESGAPYSMFVDRGHKTRQGTGKAPGYKPKPGGKLFIPPNPFFSSVVGRIAGGDLIRRATLDLNLAISSTLSKYGVNR